MNTAAITSVADTVDLGRLTQLIRSLAPAADDRERIDRLRQLEELKSAIAAAQLLEASRFDSSQRAEQAAAGEPKSQQGRGIGHQVALAMRTSPWQANRWLGWAKVLTTELPVTFGLLRAGRTTEWRALLVARETIWLSREHRSEVDALLGPELDKLGDARVEAEAKRHAYRLDPAGAVNRRRVAVGERRVTLRPRPDVMSCLSGTTPVEQGVAMWAALRREADAVLGRGEGDGRSRDQIMADTLVTRVTGQSVATAVPIEVELVMTANALFGGESAIDNPATNDPVTNDPHFGGAANGDPVVGDRATGGGSLAVDQRANAAACEPASLSVDGITAIAVPVGTARELVARSPQVWLRRLFTAPRTGELAAMDSRRRLFTDAQRRMIRYRDQYCTTPYCGAPIRHIDHAEPAAAGGATDLANGNGLCAGCNYAKQAPGWARRPGTRGTVITPTGHTYAVTPPRLVGERPIGGVEGPSEYPDVA